MLITRRQLNSLIESHLFEVELEMLDNIEILNESLAAGIPVSRLIDIGNQVKNDPEKAKALADRAAKRAQRVSKNRGMGRRLRARLEKTKTAAGLKFLDVIPDKSTGDIFRQWARKNHEQLTTAKRRKKFKFNGVKVRGLDLDAPSEKSKWNNSFMRYGFKVLGDKFNDANVAAAVDARREQLIAKANENFKEDIAAAAENAATMLKPMTKQWVSKKEQNQGYQNPFDKLKATVEKQSDQDAAKKMLKIMAVIEKIAAGAGSDVTVDELTIVMSNKGADLQDASRGLTNRKAAEDMRVGYYAQDLGPIAAGAAALLAMVHVNNAMRTALLDSSEDQESLDTLASAYA